MNKSLYKEQLEQYCKLGRLSSLTLDKHLFNLKVFCKWLGKKEFNKENLRSFIIYLQDNKSWKPSTVNSMISTLKILSRQLYDNGLAEHEFSYSLRSVKVEPFNPTLLTLKEVEAIINCPRNWGKYHKWVDRRKYDFFFELLARCALRRNEALSLRIGDFDFENGLLRILGKGNKVRTIPIPELMKTRLCLWLLERKAKVEDWVFAGRNGKSGISTFRDELKKRVEIIGINKRVHMHLFRHVWGTEAVRAQLPAEKVMKIMGHSSFQNHLRYTHLVGEDLIDTINNHPINRVNQIDKEDIRKPITELQLN